MLITLVPVVEAGMVVYPLRQPSGGEDLKSINEAAELLSVVITDERVNGEESRGAIGGAVGGERKYHSKACFELVCIKRFCVRIKATYYNCNKLIFRLKTRLCKYVTQFVKT